MLTVFGEFILSLIALGAGVFLGIKYGQKLQAWWYGAEAFAAKLKADAAKLEAKAQAVKAAVSK